MNNKTLGILIVIIILIFAGTVAYFRTRTVGPVPQEEQQNMDNYGNGSQNSDPKNTASSPTPTPTEQVAGSSAGECQRNFDSAKLASDKVAIANRQVEMDVKGFGKITLEFYDKDAPKTAENFLRLTNSGYYNCLTFHRVAKNFVIQGGDPNGNGTGGISAFGDKFADEINPSSNLYKTGYVKGVLAMANSGPNTNGSQFFIMLGDVPLPASYTIFGHVVAGLDIVEKIGQVDIVPQMGPTDGSPKTPVVMQSVKIIK